MEGFIDVDDRDRQMEGTLGFDTRLIAMLGTHLAGKDVRTSRR